MSISMLFLLITVPSSYVQIKIYGVGEDAHRSGTWHGRLLVLGGRHRLILLYVCFVVGEPTCVRDDYTGLFYLLNTGVVRFC